MSVREYIGARYVPVFADPLEWDASNCYEPLTVVTYGLNSYTSRQYVPRGVEPTNEKFWALTGNYNAQIEAYRHEVDEYTQQRLDDLAALQEGLEKLIDDERKHSDAHYNELIDKDAEIEEKIDTDISNLGNTLKQWVQDEAKAFDALHADSATNAENLTSILPIDHGGTGANNRKSAIENLTWLGFDPVKSVIDDTYAKWIELGTGYFIMTEHATLDNKPTETAAIVLNIVGGTNVMQVWFGWVPEQPNARVFVRGGVDGDEEMRDWVEILTDHSEINNKVESAEAEIAQNRTNIQRLESKHDTDKEAIEKKATELDEKVEQYKNELDERDNELDATIESTDALLRKWVQEEAKAHDALHADDADHATEADHALTADALNPDKSMQELFGDMMVDIAHGGTGANNRKSAIESLAWLGVNPVKTDVEDTYAKWIELGTGYFIMTKEATLDNKPTDTAAIVLNIVSGTTADTNVMQVWFGWVPEQPNARVFVRGGIDGDEEMRDWVEIITEKSDILNGITENVQQFTQLTQQFSQLQERVNSLATDIEEAQTAIGKLESGGASGEVDRIAGELETLQSTVAELQEQLNSANIGGVDITELYTNFNSLKQTVTDADVTGLAAQVSANTAAIGDKSSISSNELWGAINMVKITANDASRVANEAKSAANGELLNNGEIISVDNGALIKENWSAGRNTGKLYKVLYTGTETQGTLYVLMSIDAPNNVSDFEYSKTYIVDNEILASKNIIGFTGSSPYFIEDFARMTSRAYAEAVLEIKNDIKTTSTKTNQISVKINYISSTDLQTDQEFQDHLFMAAINVKTIKNL